MLTLAVVGGTRASLASLGLKLRGLFHTLGAAANMSEVEQLPYERERKAPVGLASTYETRLKKEYEDYYHGVSIQELDDERAGGTVSTRELVRIIKRLQSDLQEMEHHRDAAESKAEQLHVAYDEASLRLATLTSQSDHMSERLSLAEKDRLLFTIITLPEN